MKPPLFFGPGLFPGGGGCGVLIERDWAADLLAGYFCQPVAPWER